MLAGIVSAFVFIILVIGMLIARRKREHSTLWIPEGFFLKKETTSNKNRREPVGQDALGMKSVYLHLNVNDNSFTLGFLLFNTFIFKQTHAKNCGGITPWRSQ